MSLLAISPAALVPLDQQYSYNILVDRDGARSAHAKRIEPSLNLDWYGTLYSPHPLQTIAKSIMPDTDTRNFKLMIWLPCCNLHKQGLYKRCW